MMRLLPVLLAAACSTAQEPFAESFDARNLFLVSARVESGSFSYEGGVGEALEVQGTSWGRGRNDSLAASRMADNRWQMEVEGQSLQIEASSFSNNAGVDFDLFGPQAMGLDLVVDEGRVDLFDVEGAQVITAERFRGQGLVGDLDLYTTDGEANVELWPYEDGLIRIEAVGGGVTLVLPWGLDYDLQVWGDPAHELVVEDLGWTRSAPGPAYFAGVVGFGTIRVDVGATGGPVQILALR